MPHKPKNLILVVEDQRDISQMLDDFLSVNGYEIVQKPSIQSAIEYCESHTPNGVLLDMLMTDGLGDEIFNYLSERKIPVCITTILSREKVHRILGTQNFHYLQKPFDLKEFLRTIHAVFDNPIEM